MSDGDKVQRQKIIGDADKLYQAGHAAAAAAMLQPCLALFDDSEKASEEWGHFCMAFGSALAESSNPGFAIQIFGAAEVAYLNNPDALATVYMNTGNAYSYVNNHQATYDYYTKALHLFQDQNDDHGQATVLLLLATLSFSMNANDQAREFLTQFEQLPQVLQEYPEIRWSYKMQLASVQDAQHDPLAAIETLKQAQFAAEETGIPDYVAQTQVRLARLRQQIGDAPGALEALADAYQQARSENSPHYVSNASQYAIGLEHAGQDEQALAIYLECLDEIDLIRTQLDFGQRFRLMESHAYITRSAVALLMKNCDYTRAFEVSERGQARATLDLMFRHQRKRQGDRSVRAGRQGRIFIDSPTLAEIQPDLVRSNVHLLKLYVAGESLFAWFLAPGAPLRAWDASPALKRLVPVMDAIFRTKNRPAWTEMESRLADFWNVLLPEYLRQYLLDHPGRLLILPHRQLYYVPFAAIPQQDHRPLGETWEVAIAPSAGAFLQLDPGRDPDDRPALAAGPDTALAIGGIQEQTVEVPLIEGQPEPTIKFFFPELQFTAPEANRVIELFGGTTLIGPEATLSAVRRKMPGYRLLHFATHGYWSPGGDISVLLLSDAPLAFLDVIESPLRADLVVLSACQTGLGEPHPDSYTGIAQNFLIGGARSVLVTLWPISDSATLFFMDKFYLSLLGGHSPSEALAAAQRTMREHPGHSDGYNWAAFQLTGRPFACTSSEKFAGPIFCGGDVVQTFVKPGTPLDLTAFAHQVQGEREAFIYSPKGFDKIPKP